MCDFCKGSKFFEYEKRQKEITKIIDKYKPDVFALQEIRTKSQAQKILEDFRNYDLICTDSLLISYADPVIVYDKTLYKKIEEGQAWLGPNPNSLNFGWKFAVPRQVLWVKLERIKDKRQFYFVSSHFDNRIENLEGAAKFVNGMLQTTDLPIIFAADTNLTLEMKSYSHLVTNKFVNAFSIAKTISPKNHNPERELCYPKKGKKFPSCRVDHILLSKNHQWDVKNFKTDLTKDSTGKFPSDHRPVIVDLIF